MYIIREFHCNEGFITSSSQFFPGRWRTWVFSQSRQRSFFKHALIMASIFISIDNFGVLKNEQKETGLLRALSCLPSNLVDEQKSPKMITSTPFQHFAMEKVAPSSIPHPAFKWRNKKTRGRERKSVDKTSPIRCQTTIEFIRRVFQLMLLYICGWIIKNKRSDSSILWCDNSRLTQQHELLRIDWRRTWWIHPADKQYMSKAILCKSSTCVCLSALYTQTVWVAFGF